ncbi:MAG: sulfurtransferase [Pseudomonadota bacterium]
MKPKFLMSIVIALSFAGAVAARAEALRISPEWLKTNAATHKIIILDARLPENYSMDHIPGAISFPETLTYQQKAVSGKIVEPDIMQRMVRERGINQGDLIVVYDNGELIDASRVFWALEVYGLNQVRVMVGGYTQWSKSGYPITSETPEIAHSQFVPSIDHRKIASKFFVQLATANPRLVIIDARPEKAYRGIESSAKRFGHIPSAINIPASKNLQASSRVGEFQGIIDLRATYSNLPLDKKVIVYCGNGRVSSTHYLALRELGYDVSNYDASWLEWGNDLNLPVEK